MAELGTLEWIAWSGGIAIGAAILLAGSVFFYWGAWNILIFPGHTRPVGIEYIVMLFGGFTLIAGASLPWYAGKKLKGKHLITIALTHLIVAPPLVYLIFSITDPYWIAVFIPPTFLSNIILDTALLIGHFRKKKPSEPVPER